MTDSSQDWSNDSRAPTSLQSTVEVISLSSSLYLSETCLSCSLHSVDVTFISCSLTRINYQHYPRELFILVSNQWATAAGGPSNTMYADCLSGFQSALAGATGDQWEVSCWCVCVCGYDWWLESGAGQMPRNSIFLGGLAFSLVYMMWLLHVDGWWLPGVGREAPGWESSWRGCPCSSLSSEMSGSGSYFFPSSWLLSDAVWSLHWHKGYMDAQPGISVFTVVPTTENTLESVSPQL